MNGHCHSILPLDYPKWYKRSHLMVRNCPICLCMGLLMGVCRDQWRKRISCGQMQMKITTNRRNLHVTTVCTIIFISVPGGRRNTGIQLFPLPYIKSPANVVGRMAGRSIVIGAVCPCVSLTRWPPEKFPAQTRSCVPQSERRAWIWSEKVLHR